MADKSQFENPPVCADCEPRFAELVDETLTDAERIPVEAHVAGCASCRAALAEVRRGQAWLHILREDDLLLEPPAGLVERILAATAEDGAVRKSAQKAVEAESGSKPWTGIHLPAVRRSSWYQPRLLLTAAMAFFSVTLTLNVAGIHANDLRPKNIRHTVTRQYFQTNARVVRYYENMRVVYELESRVREFRRAAENSSSGSGDTARPSSPRKKPGGPGGSSSRPGPGDPGIAHDLDGGPTGELMIAQTTELSPFATQERSRT